ncbi:MAG: hypothetical protein MI785_14915 [Kiloniellales bacterium]|nr:hypothetical protein [Kiloniellales bacterium]
MSVQVLQQLQLLTPLVSFDPIPIEHLNRCLLAWGHKMGPLRRPFAHLDRAYGLFHDGRIVGVVSTSPLVRETAAGMGREECCELSRLCCARPDLCRVVLRLWREFVFPTLGKPWAISYQHAVAHSGNLYRFDGWVRLGTSRSGTDARSGRRGRRKVIWGWSADPTTRKAAP